jgi:hypothetical protein
MTVGPHSHFLMCRFCLLTLRSRPEPRLPDLPSSSNLVCEAHSSCHHAIVLPRCILKLPVNPLAPWHPGPISWSFSSTITPVHKLTPLLLGTSSIVSPSYPFLPHLQLLSSIVETVVHLRQQGHRVVLCSSGAIGVGLRRMGKRDRGKGLHQKQVSDT